MNVKKCFTGQVCSKGECQFWNEKAETCSIDLALTGVGATCRLLMVILEEQLEKKKTKWTSKLLDLGLKIGEGAIEKAFEVAEEYEKKREEKDKND